MYAVLKTGGKQYRVAANDVIKIEKTSGEVGEIITFDDVLMVGGDKPEIGSPMVSGAAVAGVVLEQGRADKIIVFKKKRRQNYRRTRGHRQHQTVVRITEILTGGAKPSKTAADVKPKAAPKTAAKTAAKSGDADLKPIFDTPSGPADDLTKISGVGPVLVEKLNKLGITQFQQVANLKADEIEKIDAALDFKGRIDREEWVDQAKKLAAGE